MTKNKIDALMSLKKLKQVDVAPHYEMSRSSFNNKLRTSETRFNLKDLIKLAKLTGTKLAFIDENDKPVITFDMDDIESN